MKVNSNYFKRRYTYGNKKKNYTLIVLFLTLFFTVGYAYLNTLLSINGTVKVNKNTWDVHFENIQKVDGSIDATADATISNNTTVNFTVDLQTPGDFYSFTVDVVNSGTIDAMLSEILKTGLTTEQEVYTEYTVTYNDGDEILAKDSLPSNTKDTLLVTIKYKDDITAEQLPTEDQNINLNLEANYIQDDGTSDSRRPAVAVYQNMVKQNLKNGKMVLDNESSTYVSASTGINFAAAPSDTNGKGLYVKSGTENDTYPIYYYRGAVTNNNIIFADFCWKIVRTTETGGIKLVYNGIPTDGTCNNTGEASQIGQSKFNDSADDNAYVGYMYGDFPTPENCANTDVYENQYVCSYGGSTSLENAQTNSNDSTVKAYIDSWYESNLLKYESYLEDTIWCNDRTVTKNKILSESEIIAEGYKTYMTFYKGVDRNGSKWLVTSANPSFECENQNDRFTVNETMNGRVNGNGDLTYPVALLTADEVTLSGSGVHGYSKSSYLYTGIDTYTMTPHLAYWNNRATVYGLYPEEMSNVQVYNNAGIRPSVSLAKGMKAKGKGTVDEPYVVVYD